MPITSEQQLKLQQAQADRDRAAELEAIIEKKAVMVAADLPAASGHGNAVAVPDTRTSITKYLDDVAPSGIVGRMIKFSKNGEFTTPDTEEVIGDDADFIALCDQTLIGWIKFNHDAPPDRVMGLLYDDFIMPPREVLGDMDQSAWPQGLDKQPQDPWTHQMYLVLQKGDTAELFTFVTSSRTGRRAVGNLLRHYDRMQRANPGEFPVVKLKKSGFAHRDERIGWVSTPVFVVCGRASKDSTAKPDTGLSSFLDDEIPFDR